MYIKIQSHILSHNDLKYKVEDPVYFKDNISLYYECNLELAPTFDYMPAFKT